MSTVTVSLDNVYVAYDGNTVVRGVTGSFSPGTATALAGPNGAGKSTLLKALMKDLPLASGSIDRGGLGREDFGYLPQVTQLDRQFPLTVADSVMLGAWRETGAFRGLSRNGVAKGMDAIKAVGLDGLPPAK